MTATDVERRAARRPTLGCRPASLTAGNRDVEVRAGAVPAPARATWRSWSWACAGRRSGRVRSTCADVADASPTAPTCRRQYVWHGAAADGKARRRRVPGGDDRGHRRRPGENAVDGGRRRDRARRSSCKGQLIPADVEVAETRNYGDTARRQGQQADPEADLRHAVGGGAGVGRARPARGGDRRHRGGADAGRARCSPPGPGASR
ncbi:MAG: hypothetical protein MZW92_43420 [Comamonadaceae bacterium]|nr:hypothetical protein [Comamonadaceae bacterium]